MNPRRPRSALRVLIFFVLTAQGCALSGRETVRVLASRELSCPEENIDVTLIERLPPPWSRRSNLLYAWRGTFRAVGCGGTAKFICDEWDSYNQAPVCHPGRD